MRRWRQLICCYLALCLPLAGAVGLNPVLHRLIEHGNRGPAHTHFRSAGGARSLTHCHGGDLHSHEAKPAVAQERPTRRPAHQHEFTLPTIHLRQLLAVLGEFFATQESFPASENPDHQHHSLAQLLASGLIEQGLEFTHDFCPAEPTPFLAIFPETSPITAGWNPQTASRAPPDVVG